MFIQQLNETDINAETNLLFGHSTQNSTHYIKLSDSRVRNMLLTLLLESKYKTYRAVVIIKLVLSAVCNSPSLNYIHL